MIQIFERGDLRKINFVDDTDCFIGFCADQQCCESFGWGITDAIPTKTPADGSQPEKIEGYHIDRDFISVIEEDAEKGAVVFRLVSKRSPPLYLVLWNHHNGYYSHLLTVNHSGTSVSYRI